MAERLIISVDPGPVEQSQRVQDVFGHVLDLFELLGQSGQAEDASVVWRLVRVSMNSPLTVEAEAIALRTAPVGLDLQAVARRQRTNFVRNVDSLRTGVFPEAWRKEVARARRAFAGPQARLSTRVEAPSNEAGVIERVEIVPDDRPLVEKAIVEASRDAAVRPKTQRGSVEGQLRDITTHHGKPAIKLLERRSRSEVWCIVSEAHREKIAAAASFDDVWTGRRVRVEGTLIFEESGRLARVMADAVHMITARDVAVEEIHDPNATLGMSTDDYIDRFREGTLG